ncbi:hypothetical protein Daudx_0344 [Candidatus Desulforudis audaxviator]|nr:hypothetical protein Daudx_0344 [Candidatus Desulforudis audaxviator]
MRSDARAFLAAVGDLNSWAGLLCHLAGVPVQAGKKVGRKARRRPKLTGTSFSISEPKKGAGRQSCSAFSETKKGG